jgi:hypothetical protein
MTLWIMLSVTSELFTTLTSKVPSMYVPKTARVHAPTPWAYGCSNISIGLYGWRLDSAPIGSTCRTTETKAEEKWQKVKAKDPAAPKVMESVLKMTGLEQVKAMFVDQYHRITLAQVLPLVLRLLL